MFSKITMKCMYLALSASLVATMLVGLAPSEAVAKSQCIAGVAPFKAGQKGIYVNHATLKMPHSVIVQPTNTAGFSTISDSTYFNVLKLKTDQFQVQHKRSDDGVPIVLDVNVSLYWIACTHN